MSKNILILTNSISGLYSFRMEVVKAIADAGYVVYISFPDQSEKCSYFEAIGCHLIYTSFKRRGMNPAKDVKLLMSYINMIKCIKPVVVLTYTIKPNIYGGIASALCNVAQFANITGLGDTIENPGILRILTVNLYKLGLRKCSTVFFQNETNMQICNTLGIAKIERAQLLPGSGVNTEYHTYQEYPIDGKVKFLYIGRLKKDKGTQEYIEAATSVFKRYPNTEFQIVGYEEEDFCNKMMEPIQKGIIKYLGPQSDVRPYIGAVHCTVMPSYHEGMSNVNLESSANGRPVITTNVPGCFETIDDGKTGFLVKAKDAEDLAIKMEQFILLPYEQKRQMGIAGREKVEKEFNRQIVIDAYLNAIRQINK